MTQITGLTSAQVKKKKSLGLSNQKIDSYSPTYLTIIRRNFVNPMNMVLIPLMGMLLFVGLYQDFTFFVTYITINTILNSFEEIRIKRRLEGLLQEFKIKVKVIRDSKEIEISADEVVQGDYIKAKEGEGIVADGKVVEEKYLQIDESALTGESKYLKKNIDDNLLSGSFIVTGECIYIAKNVGKDNYLNQLGSKSATYKKRKSYLEKIGQNFIYFFVAMGLLSAIANYYFAKEGGASEKELLRSVTTIIATAIPQTLIFLFTLSFVVSITKLSKKGVLIQKRGSIDDLANIDTLCIDKTGTITTNTMSLEKTNYWNMEEEDFGNFINNVSPEIQGRNKTSETLELYFKSAGATSVGAADLLHLRDQIPFTSQSKFSAFLLDSGAADLRSSQLFVLGAYSIIESLVDNKIKNEITNYVELEEKSGARVLASLKFDGKDAENVFEILKRWNDGMRKDTNVSTFQRSNVLTSSVAIFSIKENLNPGIKEVLDRLKNQDIDIKIISGDSLNSVCDVAQKVGIDTSRAVDLSITNETIARLVLEKNIFTRATPEDKLKIITALKKSGKKVAMVGDGINDVLGMKQATVSIAMENGARITRDIADIVLLKNNYKKIPEVFYEGDNLVFNLKLTTKIFLAKAFIAYFMAIYFSILKEPVPILPTTTLLYSFIGTTFPSFFVSFSRQEVKDNTSFTKSIISSGTLTGIAMGIISLVLYYSHKNDLNHAETSTFVINGLLSISLLYSFFLMYQVKKLRNLFQMAIIVIFAVMFGYLQGTMPFYFYPHDLPFMILLIYLSIWASFAALFWLKKVTFKGKVMPKKMYAIPVGLFLLATFFPSRWYYATDPFNLKYYPVIIVTSISFLVWILVIHKIIKLIGLDK